MVKVWKIFIRGETRLNFLSFAARNRGFLSWKVIYDRNRMGKANFPSVFTHRRRFLGFRGKKFNEGVIPTHPYTKWSAASSNFSASPFLFRVEKPRRHAGIRFSSRIRATKLASNSRRIAPTCGNSVANSGASFRKNVGAAMRKKVQ